jgi:hypothetical protein
MKLLLRFLRWLGGPAQQPTQEEQDRLNLEAARSV